MALQGTLILNGADYAPFNLYGCCKTSPHRTWKNAFLDGARTGEVLGGGYNKKHCA